MVLFKLSGALRRCRDIIQRSALLKKSLHIRFAVAVRHSGGFSFLDNLFAQLGGTFRHIFVCPDRIRVADGFDDAHIRTVQLGIGRVEPLQELLILAISAGHRLGHVGHIDLIRPKSLVQPVDGIRNVLEVAGQGAFRRFPQETRLPCGTPGIWIRPETLQNRTTD